MEFSFSSPSVDHLCWASTLPAFLGSEVTLNANVLFSLLAVSLSLALLTWALSTAGVAWGNGRTGKGPVQIPGCRGVPIFGSLFSLSRGLAHRTLAAMANSASATQLMAFSLGSTPVVVSSDPQIAREILTSPCFANRPVKQSAKSLMFGRAIGFAPSGTYWRLLRRIATSHLFAPRRILAHEAGRQLDCAVMLRNIADEQSLNGFVSLRKHLQFAALNNIMGSVFGRRYDQNEESTELKELVDMVRQGFDLLGAFNWSDYLPWLSNFYDPFRINERCKKLVPKVTSFVKKIIDEHRIEPIKLAAENSDFVDVLLSLDGEEALNEDDMVAVLWEMIFRGTDTTALLTEWIMAELVLHPEAQAKLRAEIVGATGREGSHLTDAQLAQLPYLQAVVKETLRIHPPGPLLSWARLSTSEVQLSNGMVIPADTTAMVNMWAITHSPNVWENPLEFRPERFIGADDVDVRGGDLRLAPFGAGRRVCPGKNLGLVTVALWVAKLVERFVWSEDPTRNVDLSEVLKLSCEMKHPLHALVVGRSGF